MSHDHAHAAAVDVHAHWYPRAWLDLVRDHGPAHGVEWTDVPGKGPQFKVGYLPTGPAGPLFVDLDARLEAMDAQGVEVHALSGADGEITLRVSDDGPGVPPEERERIFVAGSSSKTATSDHHGQGIGLALVSRIVQRRHGSVSIEDRPGGGAVFAVYLPPLAGAATAPAAPSGASR